MFSTAFLKGCGNSWGNSASGPFESFTFPMIKNQAFQNTGWKLSKITSIFLMISDLLFYISTNFLNKRSIIESGE
jgi:hypothetical protein